MEENKKIYRRERERSYIKNIIKKERKGGVHTAEREERGLKMREINGGLNIAGELRVLE